MKGNFDLATSIGWEARRFHYIERPRELSHYLTPPKSPEQQREQGAQNLRQMIQRMKQKQEAASGTE